MDFARHIIEIPRLMEANMRAQELRALIRDYDHAYYVLNSPVVDDAAYDALYHELKALEAKYPNLVDANSPTQRVGGAPIGGLEKVRHQRRMLSLANTYNPKEVLSWFDQGEEVLVEPKIDGASLKLIYERGLLVRAVNRGDGETGNDVTAAARTIRTIPLELSEEIDLIVTGEVYMTFSVFEELNARLEAEEEKLFANPRNAASGTLNMKDPAEVSRRKLNFVVHGCVTEFPNVATQRQLIEYLEMLGFQSTYMLPVTASCMTVSRVVNVESEDQIKALIDELDALRKILNCPTDGLVFKINDLAKQRDLGEGTKEPNWAVAYKYPPERKATALYAITLQVGKTGKITPVAEIQEIPLSGTVVKRASLCNADEIARLGINIGDLVYVEKSAEIIPKVVGLAKKNAKGIYAFPATCPCCMQPLERAEGMVDWYCVNANCEEIVFQKLRYATGKHALDIRGCGEQMVRSLMQAGVRSLVDLFSIEDVPSLKPAARKAFFEGREQAKKQPFWRQLAALNIEGMGAETCKNLADRFDNIPQMLDEDTDAIDVVQRIINDKVTFQNFLNFLATATEELNALDALGLKFEKEAPKSLLLKGKVIAITGGLMSGSRDQVMKLIEEHGGVFKANATSLCTHLVVGSDAGRVKVEKAKKYGIPVISEEELYDMMGMPMPLPKAVDPNHEF